MNVIKTTQTLCPECLKILLGTIFEKDGKVMIKKTCPEHGDFEDVYWGDYEMYKRSEKFAKDGKGIDNPNVELSKACPQNCGLCNMHKSHTALGNIVVTNRCDLQCFYCFFYAKAMGYVYEPTLDQIREMLRNMRKEKPVPCTAVQLTGGNPEIREDLLDIIKIAKEEGYHHVQLNINGTHKLQHDAEWAKKVRDAGVNTVYLSFDGTTQQTNPKNHKEIPKMLENARKAGMGIVLVPTVINTVNDHDVGNILRFGIKNIDVVRGINFQPVSLVGRISKADREKMRITIPDVIKRMEEQTNGAVSKDDWYPVPTVAPITHFVEAITKKPMYELSAHHACGMATYLFLDGDKIVPLPRFVDVEGLVKYLDEKAEEIKGGKNRAITSMKVISKIGSFIDKEKQPKNLDLKRILINALVKHNYKALGELHHKSLFVGMMHFQDLYNYDIERVKRCCIHYAQPDGKIVPFCAFNVIPQWYRDKIQKEYSLSIEEWEKKTGRKLEDDFYKRQ
ncbi:MAG: radical SAM protein [Candidatus Aenigmarchaeota archaeon]|nr:radical SAM protein [Candidatus Aenigmarchaeota archaeon]